MLPNSFQGNFRQPENTVPLIMPVPNPNNEIRTGMTPDQIAGIIVAKMMETVRKELSKPLPDSVKNED